MSHHNGEIARFRDQIRPARLGEALTIVAHPFANPVENHDLFSSAVRFGLKEADYSKANELINGTGFNTRHHHFSPETDVDLNDVLEREVAIGAFFLREAVKTLGGVDLFIDSSATLPREINQRILAEAGLNSHSVESRSYRYACAGAAAAIIDALADPNLRDARIVVGAMEPLSYLIKRDHFTLENLAIPSIFGDGHAFAAFLPNRFELKAQKVLVKPDNGVIKVEAGYHFDDFPHDETSVPSHYSSAAGGERILHYSKHGAALNLEKATGSTIFMDGLETLRFFGAETPNLIQAVIAAYGQADFLFPGNSNVVLHPASRPVVERVAKMLVRSKLLPPDSKLPFLMDQARLSNSSSATILNYWAYMINNDLFDSSLDTLLVAPGIGSVIAAAILKLNP